MTAEPEYTFALQAESLPRALTAAVEMVQEMRVLHELHGRRITHLEALVGAMKDVLVPQVPPEPQSASDEATEPDPVDPPYLGWREGDPIDIPTMGGSR